MVNVMMERIPVQMELDTGALPLLPLMMYMYQENVLTCTVPLQTTDTCIRTSGERIYQNRKVLASTRKKPRTVRLHLVVVEGARPPLYGRNWLAHILINWQEIKKVKTRSSSKHGNLVM